MTFIERHIGILAVAIAAMVGVRIFFIADAQTFRDPISDQGFFQYRSWFQFHSSSQDQLAEMITSALKRKRSAAVIAANPLDSADIITGSTNPPPEEKPNPQASSDPKSGEGAGSAKSEAKAPEANSGKAAGGEGEKNSKSPAPIPTLPQAELSAERSLLERLGLRRNELDQREADLANREALLQAAEKRLADRTEELKRLEEELKQRTDARNAELQSLKPIVTIYETMKPKDAARVFDKMEFANLLSVASAMNPRKLSDVLSLMDPAIAGKLTKSMSAAGRSGVLPQPVAKLDSANELPDLSPQGNP